MIRGNNLTTGSQKFVDGGFVFVTPEKAKAYWAATLDAVCRGGTWPIPLAELLEVAQTTLAIDARLG